MRISGKGGYSMLKQWIPAVKPEKEELEKRLDAAQEELGRLQMQIKEHKLPVLVLIVTCTLGMLPAVIFVVACILAFASGTSWGTFGILIPIVTAVFPADSNLLIIGISACCAGAVCGDHCSPISDTTIMASAGAQCEHLNHVTTQLPYAVTVAIVSFVGFIVAGFVQNVFVTWAVGIVLLLGALFLIRAIERKKAA